MTKHSIRIGIVGVGNCASSLLQGIEFYRENSDKNRNVVPLGLDAPRNRRLQAVGH